MDGRDFADYGVYVSASKGLTDGLSHKAPAKINWPDEHGEIVDLSFVRYSPRSFSLECFIKGEDKADFLTKFSAFIQRIKKSGLRQLRIDVVPGKPLVYMVYCPDAVSLTKKWNEGTMTGTFSLKFDEPEPVKSVLRYFPVNGEKLKIKLSTPDFLNIHFGDGSSRLDVTGRDVSIEKGDYAGGQYHYIVITGNIPSMEISETNADFLY